MIYIYRDTQEVLLNWTSNDGLLLMPNKSVSSFIVKSLDKYGILRAKEEVMKLINSNKKNISISQIEEYFTDNAYLDIYSKPNRGQLEQLFNKTVTNISEGRDIYCSIDGFVLFIEWAKDNYSEFDQKIYYDGNPEDIFNGYGETKIKPITLNNLDKLIKLFCLFYGKSIPKEDIYLISDFQNKITELDLIFFEELSQVIQIITTKYEEHKEELPSNNIFNKILEMLENLELIKDNFSIKEDVKLKVLVPSKEIKEKYSTDFKELLGF